MRRKRKEHPGGDQRDKEANGALELGTISAGACAFDSHWFCHELVGDFPVLIRCFRDCGGLVGLSPFFVKLDEPLMGALQVVVVRGRDAIFSRDHPLIALD